MKKIVHKYRISKFKRFANSLIFAVISCSALVVCFIGSSARPIPKNQMLLPFTVAVISLILGFFTMFHQDKKSRIGNYSNNL